MKKKYLYIILGWSLVFLIYSVLSFIGDEKQINKINKNTNSRSTAEDNNSEEIITIDLPDEISKGLKKIPVILEENAQEYGVYKKILKILIDSKKDFKVFREIDINEVYFIKNAGRLVVDFKDNFLSAFKGGTSVEFEFLNFFTKNIFLINTVLNAENENFNEIKSIFYIFSGNPIPTIAGHIDVENPFMRKSKIIMPFVNVRKLFSTDNGRSHIIRRIIIDPGHGGDSIGVTDQLKEIQEKDINLIIGNKLKRRIINTLGLDTVLTRGNDTSMSLESRASKANNQKADLFISIHVNSSVYASKHGGQAYISSLSVNKVNSEIISKSTETEKENIINDDLKKKDNAVQYVDKGIDDLKKWNGAQEIYVSDSYKLAQLIQTELNHLNITEGRKVRQLPMKLLSAVSMPAVLIEVAYISNKSDEMKLKDGMYLTKISEAIFRGISSYINYQNN